MLRTADAGLADTLTTSHNVGVRVSVWRSGDLLAENLPVVDGSLSEAADQQVPESLELTIAQMDSDGISYVPTGRGSDSVIGSDGHRLFVTYIIDRGSKVLTCPLGWYRINSWDRQDGEITLSASGLLSLVNDYKLLAPTSPPSGATLKSEIVRLIEGQLPINVSATGDRSASSTLAWTEDRLGAVYEVADAWPADLRVDAFGTLQVSNIPSGFTPDLVLTEGEGGTVVLSGDGGQRDGIYNIVVARGEDSGDPSRTPVTGVASDTSLDSPTNIFDFGAVVSFYSSPLLTTTGSAKAAAATVLARSLAMATSIPVSILPDPRITYGTLVELHRLDGRIQNTIVTALSLPLTASGGAQTLTLGAAA